MHSIKNLHDGRYVHQAMAPRGGSEFSYDKKASPPHRYNADLDGIQKKRRSIYSSRRIPSTATLRLSYTSSIHRFAFFYFVHTWDLGRGGGGDGDIHTSAWCRKTAASRGTSIGQRDRSTGDNAVSGIFGGEAGHALMSDNGSDG